MLTLTIHLLVRLRVGRGREARRRNVVTRVLACARAELGCSWIVVGVIAQRRKALCMCATIRRLGVVGSLRVRRRGLSVRSGLLVLMLAGLLLSLLAGLPLLANFLEL